MKDLYTFDTDVDAARATYETVQGAYRRIFDRVFAWDQHVPAWRAAEADTGAMGGKVSHEYHVEDAAGEDVVMTCDSCSFAANTERAVPRVREHSQNVTIDSFAHRDGAALAIYPKGRVLNEALLPWPATPGSGSVAVIAVDRECDLDEESARRIACECGYDATNSKVLHSDIRTAKSGDGCSACENGTLHEHRAIEVGHAFLLGSRYTQALGYGIAVNGKRVPMQMGCYGIGVTRIMGALAQRASALYKENVGEKGRAGFIWPLSVAPYSAVVVPAPPFSPEKMQFAERVCESLQHGVTINNSTVRIAPGDIVLDDREGTLGTRMFDADLLGYPMVVVLGRHWERTGEVEVRRPGHEPVYVLLG